MKVGVVIPTYGHWELTRRCLDALDAERAGGLIGEVVVVDDGAPPDPAADAIVNGRARLLRLATNSGVATASNAGAKLSGGDAVLLLNNDTMVRPGAIAALVRALDDPAVGIVGPKLIYDDGTLQAAGLAFRAGGNETWHLHGHLDPELPDANVSRDFPALIGAVTLVRRSLWDAIGGYDEGYRNGWEDLDLCFRAWSRGMRVRYEPAAEVEHLEGASVGRVEANPRNRERFSERWSNALAALPRIAVGEPPCQALAVERRPAGFEAFAFASLCSAWRAGVGARVTVVRSRVDLVRAHALAVVDRRGLLDVAWNPSRTAADVAFVTPADDREAAIAAGASATEWWTPSAHARALLVAAGADAARVRVVALGVDDDVFAPGDRSAPAVALPLESADDPQVSVVKALAARGDVAVDVLIDERRAARVRSALPRDVRIVEIEASGTALRSALARARAFVAPAVPDPYDLLLGAARSAGCAIVTTPDRARTAKLDPVLTATAAPGELADAALARVFAPDDERARLTALTRAEAVRRHRAMQGAARARELARVLENGHLEGERAVMDARAAAALRDAAQR